MTQKEKKKRLSTYCQNIGSNRGSHGVTVDLDGDSLIGLPKGQEPAILGEQDQATLKQLLDESKTPVGGTSRAFEKAKALNPEPSPEVQEELQHRALKKKSIHLLHQVQRLQSLKKKVREVESVYDKRMTNQSHPIMEANQ